MNGHKFLKVTGILMIIAAVFSIIAGVFVGGLGALAAGLGAASGLTFAYWAALFLTLVGGICQLIAGIKGVKHSKHSEKSRQADHLGRNRGRIQRLEHRDESGQRRRIQRYKYSDGCGRSGFVHLRCGTQFQGRCTRRIAREAAIKEIDTYMGLFDKKYCDICGEKIGLLGNRKLENGNLCKNCAKKLSPWFSDRRSSTVEEIKQQLAYREENRQKVAAFHTTRTLGTNTKVLLDEDAGKFMVTRARDLQEANPDVLDFADVTGCNLDIDESRSELKREDKDGKEVSYNPPRYEYSYDFYITIFVNNPYFNEMRFQVNSSSVDITPPPAMRPGMTTTFNPETNVEYRNYKKLGEEIRQALTQVRKDVREKIEQAAAPKAAVTCPYCGATTTPDASGCCEYCGGAVNG